MNFITRVFNTNRAKDQAFTWGDLLVLLGLAALLYAGVQIAFNAPQEIRGPTISLSPSALPWYTLLSLGRMTAAYLLSLVFTLFYGRAAAQNPRSERILMPLLDVLQSVPILSFLPVVLLSLSAILPVGIAAELASILLIFTSQVWNLTFAWYQSLTTIPTELREASSIFRLNAWFKFTNLELPFGILSLVWNSMVSWAGGWFFLMAAEIFTVGQRDFRLPGLGAYLREAADQQDLNAILWGVVTLILTILLLDQLFWRPLMAWSDRFKVQMVVNDNPPTSWFYDLLRSARITSIFANSVISPLSERVNQFALSHYPMRDWKLHQDGKTSWSQGIVWLVLGIGVGYAFFRMVILLSSLPAGDWSQIGLGVGSTLLRVLVALILALAWTVPVGIAIGSNPRLATALQPVVQVVASVPATAIFPVFLLVLLRLPGGINIAAILLMLLGTQWYLLFNVIAGASAIPRDLKYTARLIHLSRWQRWTTLTLPALFPYIVTGAITASGGAWNASIVSEYVSFGGQSFQTIGIGSIIAQSTATGNYALLLAATLSLILTVIVINRVFWRKLYQAAEERYRME